MDKNVSCRTFVGSVNVTGEGKYVGSVLASNVGVTQKLERVFAKGPNVAPGGHLFSL
jgi:hypothetical protein